MTAATTLVWFRQDLRLDDNPALAAAVERAGADGAVVAVFIDSDAEEGAWRPSAASRWWLHQSLAALDRQLRALKSRLVLRQGPALDALLALVKETGATAVLWNRRYEPAAIARDTQVKRSLQQARLTAESFNAALLYEPWQIATKQAKPFQVFTAYWKACRAVGAPQPPRRRPKDLPAPKRWPRSLELDELKLEPTIDWAGGLGEMWQPGEEGASQRLARFLKHGLSEYQEHRNLPSLADSSSQLSPHLHFGEIGPRQVWHAVKDLLDRNEKLPPKARQSAEVFLTEIGWREFAHHLLFRFPQTTDEPLRERFVAFPWRKDTKGLRAWQRGQTGYPFVDAGMRQLWHTGWMHNRVRMIVASFLTKHLLLPWQAGARWFWDTLVDADLANNTLGWQWTAGCGADAAPYFRIFNPVSQGKQFDASGDYVRQWVPELAKLPDRWIHRPWEAPQGVLADSGVTLGKTYPRPIVDQSEARQRALDAFKQLSG
jgi:deoxyribodipyrimidine photo-lyase